MELSIETIDMGQGKIFVSFYIKEFELRVLIDQKEFHANEMDDVKNSVEDFNERPWKYPDFQNQVRDKLYKVRIDMRSTPKKILTEEELAKQKATSEKIKATKLRNQQANREMDEYVAKMKKEASQKHKIIPREDNFHSSCLYGFHDIHVYVEPSMSDDCFGFGEIKVQQTLDDDVETLYAFYDDYIF